MQDVVHRNIGGPLGNGKVARLSAAMAATTVQSSLRLLPIQGLLIVSVLSRLKGTVQRDGSGRE